MPLKRIMPLYIVIFFGFVGYSMMITLFTPLFMYDKEGILPLASTMSTRVIVLGVVLALFPFAQFMSAPIFGALSDRFGRRPILLLSLYAAPLCYAVIALSLMLPSVGLLMFGCLLAGISQANIVIAQSAIVDVAPKEERNRLFGYIYLSTSLAYIMGPLFGGKLADPKIVTWFGYPIPFWAICALLIGLLFWTKSTFEETKREKELHVSYRHAFSAFFSVFTSKKLRTIYFVNFLIYFAIFGFFRCYPMFIVGKFRVDTSSLSEFIAWVAVPIVLVNLGITGALSKKYSPKTLTQLAVLLMGVFMMSIVIPASSSALWITLFLTSSAIALALPSCSTMLSYKASASEQGRVMGNNQSLQVAAEALSAFAGGLIASISVSLSLIALAVIAFISAVLIFSFRHSLK